MVRCLSLNTTSLKCAVWQRGVKISTSLKMLWCGGRDRKAYRMVLQFGYALYLRWSFVVLN